ncbi:MAG TPA: hypothetical protein VFX97_17045 [Pyrinomonadaceae bacterium]|nr:hypothetical protein [Pyrinomonadaceae bacterium]
MKVDTYQCDICRVQKKDANHWFEGYLLSGEDKPAGVQIHRWGSNPVTGEVHGPSPEHADVHLCGAACAINWISENLLN